MCCVVPLLRGGVEFVIGYNTMLPSHDDRLVDLIWSREDFLFDSPSFAVEQHCTIAAFLQNILIDTFTRVYSHSKSVKV